MLRRLVPSLACLGLLAPLVGCTGTGALKEEFIAAQQENASQLGLLKKQNELLNRKLNDANEELNELLESSERISADFAEYINRPEEVKLEIIQEVNLRFSGITKNQETHETRVAAMIDTMFVHLADSTDTRIVETNKMLAQHATFVDFVATQQDSINRVFAMRFDSRPWYQSIIGKWEDMERTRLEAESLEETP